MGELLTSSRFVNLAKPYEFAEEMDVRHSTCFLYLVAGTDNQTGTTMGQLHLLDCVQPYRGSKLQLPEWLFEQPTLQLCHAAYPTRHCGSRLPTLRDPRSCICIRPRLRTCFFGVRSVHHWFGPAAIYSLLDIRGRCTFTAMVVSVLWKYLADDQLPFQRLRPKPGAGISIRVTAEGGCRLLLQCEHGYGLQ